MTREELIAKAASALPAIEAAALAAWKVIEWKRSGGYDAQCVSACEALDELESALWRLAREGKQN